MKILHFIGEGKGVMSGIREYIVISDGQEEDEAHTAPGFKLESVTISRDLPTTLPINTTLIPF